MRRRTFKKKKRFLRKLLRSSLSLLKIILKKILIIIKGFIKYALPEAIFSFVILGGLITIAELVGLFIAFGMPQNIASVLAIAISSGLLILAVFVSYKLNRKKKSAKNKGEGEIQLAARISRIFANRKSQQWDEYQDWLHDILLARQQLLDAKCPRWKVKLITYKRLSAFCIVVAISKVKQTALRIGRSR